MTTRWDVERAVLVSELPSNSRYLVLLLATRADGATAVIPPRYSPSLTELTRWSGLARSTVAVHLNIVEGEGWVIRRRPTPHKARTKHARTHYSLHVPELVRSPPWSSPAGGSELVRPTPGASPAAVHKAIQTPLTSRADAREGGGASDDLEDAGELAVLARITEVLRELAPGEHQAHTREWAERVAKAIAGGRRNRTAYVEKVIRNDPPTYLPTPEPPRFRAPRKDST